MPAVIQQQGSDCQIKLEGQVTLQAAADLKGLLLQALANGKPIILDLEDVDTVDITMMQLLWSAGLDAARQGVRVTGRASQAALAAMRNAGFVEMPGFAHAELENGEGDSHR